jgi:hypothetical protein
MTAAKILAVAAFWLAVGLVQIFRWGHGTARAAALAMLLLAIPFAAVAAARTPAPVSPSWRRAVDIGGILLLVLVILFFAVRITDQPHLIDIATTTLAAGNAVLHGVDPYAATIDAGTAAYGATGYKYLPVMFATYLPLAKLFGWRGVLLTNLVLLVGCLALMRKLARSNLAAFLLLMLPIVSLQIFGKGVTDLAAVLPLLAAFAVAPYSSFFSGLCLGLSISAKPLPGGAFIPSLIPPAKRLRYAGGAGLGLLPVLAFFWAAPRDFLANIVFFNMRRPADSTSWLFGLPPSVAAVMRALFVALVVAAGVYVYQAKPSFPARCAVGTGLTIAAILAGPGAHDNYQLWWLPFYCVMLSLALAPAGDDRTRGGAVEVRAGSALGAAGDGNASGSAPAEHL